MVALVLIVVVPLTPYLDDLFGLDRVQCWLFQKFGEIAPRPLQASYTRLVMIGDDEYYRGELQHRRPIHRDYLAKIVDALAAANVPVIALDFDLRVPDPSRGARPGDYAALADDFPDEVRTLVAAIARAAQTHLIVLPKRISERPDGRYALSPDVYTPYGLCAGLSADGTWDNPGTAEVPLTPQAKANIRCGYVALPRDMCQVAPALDIVGQHGRIDSFGLALARAWDGQKAANVADAPYFGTYLSPGILDDPNVTVSAGRLLAGDPAALAVVRYKPVIVGARWHVDAYGVGRNVDLHWTPVGWINGTMIHQSYAEAILDNRLYALLPDWTRYVLETLFALAAAFLFAAYARTWSKVAVLAGFVIALPVAQWLMLQLAGVDFQALPALIALFLHALFEHQIDHAAVKLLPVRWR